MTDQLKQLSEAATQGEWQELGTVRGCVFVDGEKIQKANDFNSLFACILVNAYRAGELIPASEARAQVAVAYEVAAEQCEHHLSTPEAAKVYTIRFLEKGEANPMCAAKVTIIGSKNFEECNDVLRHQGLDVLEVCEFAVTTAERLRALTKDGEVG